MNALSISFNTKMLVKSDKINFKIAQTNKVQTVPHNLLEVKI